MKGAKQSKIFYPYIGIAGSLVAYLFIAFCVLISPWFSWYDNALSDFGNTALHPSTGWIYNFGIEISGILIAIFAVLMLKYNHSWKYFAWGVPLIIGSLDLFLVGVFNETFGAIHGIVSVIFFLFIGVTMLIYSYVSFPLGTPKIGALALLFGILSAVIWMADFPWKGVAIQETATSAMTALLIIVVSLNLLKRERSSTSLDKKV